jgi:hypothetical protein
MRNLDATGGCDFASVGWSQKMLGPFVGLVRIFQALFWRSEMLVSANPLSGPAQAGCLQTVVPHDQEFVR